MKKGYLLIGLLVLQVLVTVLVGSSIAYGLEHDKAPTGFRVWGKDLSGVTESQAWAEIEAVIPTEVLYNGSKFPLETSRSRQSLTNWLHEQYVPASGLAAPFRFLAGRLSLEPPQILLKDEIMPQLESLKTKINREPRAASIVYQGSKLVKKGGQTGIELNLEESWSHLLDSNGGSAPLAVTEIPVHPDNTEVDKIQNILGDYTTYFNINDKGRTNNVRLAAVALDGQLIAPGEVFSFNGTVGERTAASGYLPAYIFSANEVIRADGGGVCQDSTTLYQAARQANLAIEERHPHSLPVYYVPKGNDATVAYGTLDFRFRNDTSGYLLLSARTGANWLRIRIFGAADAKHLALARPEGYPIQPKDWVNDPK